MAFTYMFLSSDKVPKGALEDIFISFDNDPQVTYLSEEKGYIVTKNNIDGLLSQKAFKIHERLSLRISFLRVHSLNELSFHLLNETLSFYPNTFRYMSDILFKEMSFGNFASFPLLYREFAKVPKEILGTMGAYLRYGCNALEASKSLYIHRNTFLFRLDKFKKITNLDVRDYHDALLLEIYFQMLNH